MKFDMGQAWSEAVAMIGANREVMLIIAGVFSFLPSLAAVLFIPEVQPPAGEDPAQLEQFITAYYAANAPAIVILSVLQAVGFIAMLALLRDDSKPTVGEALKIGAVGLLPYLGTQLIIALGGGIALGIAIGVPAQLGLPVVALVLGVVAIPVFVYVLIKISLSLPIIAIEKVMNPFVILRRSWTLTKGNSLALLAFYALLIVAFIVISIVAGMIIGFPIALLGPGTAELIAKGLVSGGLSAIGLMIFAGVLAAIHRQLAGPSAARLSETFE